MPVFKGSDNKKWPMKETEKTEKRTKIIQHQKCPEKNCKERGNHSCDVLQKGKGVED